MLLKTLYDTNPEMRADLQSVVKTASPSVKSQIVDVITLAFSTDPVARWMYPDAQQFLVSFPNFVRMFGGKAFEGKSAYYIDGFAAASLWLAPGVSPNEQAITALFKNSVDCSLQDELFYIFEQMGNYHPKDPHWYLPLIGADPARQGKGFGSILLGYALKRCDAENKPAYLESSNPKNIPLYERFGFRTLGRIQVGSSPPLFPMRREPNQGISAYDAQADLRENN